MSSSGKLAGQVAIVTGAGRGIGRGIAEKFAIEGASVIVNDLDAAPAEEVVAAIVSSGGTATASVGSVHDRVYPDRLMAAALDTYEQIDIVVNNAGYATYSAAEDHTDEQWDQVIDVLMSGPFRILRPIGRYWRDNPLAEGAPRRKIVNVSSVGGVAGGPRQVSYSAGKSGVLGLTYTLAFEWGKYGVNCNAILPGLTRTRLTEGTDEGRDFIEIDGNQVPIGQPDIISALDNAPSFVPVGRAADPIDIGNAVFLLASPEADYITGQALLVDGGLRVGGR